MKNLTTLNKKVKSLLATAQLRPGYSFISFTDKTNQKNKEALKTGIFKYRLKIHTYRRLEEHQEKAFIKKVKSLSDKILEVRFHTPDVDSLYRGYVIYTIGAPSSILVLTTK